MQRIINSKRGQVGDIIIAMLVICFAIYFIISFTSGKAFFKAQERVDDIVRSHVDIVRKKGIFTEQNYKDLIIELSQYGGFEIYLRLECANDYGGTDLYFAKASILGKELRAGDHISIYVENRDSSLFGTLLSRNMLFGASGKTIDLKLNSASAGTVQVNAN